MQKRAPQRQHGLFDSLLLDHLPVEGAGAVFPGMLGDGLVKIRNGHGDVIKVEKPDHVRTLDEGVPHSVGRRDPTIIYQTVH